MTCMCIAISKLFIWAERLALVEEVRESLNLNNTQSTQREEKEVRERKWCVEEKEERERERE